MSTGTVYSTGPKLDTRGFHVKRMVHVPSAARARAVIPTRARDDAMITGGGVLNPMRSQYHSVRGIGQGRAMFDVDHRCNVDRTRLVTTGPRLGNRGGVGGKAFLYVPCPGTRARRGVRSRTVPASDRLFHRGQGGARHFDAVGTTIVLPFLSKMSGDRSSHVIRCCRNLLVTMSDLGHANASVSLCACGSNPRDTSLGSVLNGDRVGSVSVVFKPLCRRRVGPLTRFTGGRSAHLIVPFASGSGAMFRGPTICRVGAPRSCLCSRICSRFIHRFPGTGIVFVRTDRNAGSGTRFVGKLGSRLHGHSVPVGDLGRSIAMRSLGAMLHASHRGVFVPASNDGLALVGVLPRLALLIHRRPRDHVRLFNCPR